MSTPGIPTGSQVKFAIGLEPADAVAHLRAKGAAVTGGWTDWLDGQHARAFTVANVAKLDVVTDIQDSLVKALQGGQTLEQWRDGLIPTLRAKGWWKRDGTAAQLAAAGRVDAATGEIAKGLNPYRLTNIYRTNMQSAYMAGRYQAMVAQASSRPYWEYVAVMDRRTRPAHAAMNGRIFRFDDAGWQSFYPPCGYGCRCRVRSHSQRDIERKGLPVSSSDGKLRQVDVPLRDGLTARVTRYQDAGMGQPGYMQPDPGFDHNPAMSTWMPRLAGKPPAVSDAFVRQVVQGPAFERFVKAKGQLEGTFPVGVRQGVDDVATDPGVYLASDDLAAGVGASVSLERLRLLPDLVAVGEQLDGGVRRLIEPDGMLQATLAERDGLLQVVALSWNPTAAP
jgi:SPP1 gp7 family putative phage head morphogenesis protein